MAASAAVERDTSEPRLSRNYVVKSASVAYPGALAGLDPVTGRTTPWADVANYQFLGFYDGNATATGNAGGTVSASVDTSGRTLENVSVVGVTALTDVGKRVYASDDNTFTLTASANVNAIGRLVRWRTSTFGDVQLFTANDYTAGA